jgi:hypothetical protein
LRVRGGTFVTAASIDVQHLATSAEEEKALHSNADVLGVFTGRDFATSGRSSISNGARWVGDAISFERWLCRSVEKRVEAGETWCLVWTFDADSPHVNLGQRLARSAIISSHGERRVKDTRFKLRVEARGWRHALVHIPNWATSLIVSIKVKAKLTKASRLCY